MPRGICWPGSRSSAKRSLPTCGVSVGETLGDAVWCEAALRPVRPAHHSAASGKVAELLVSSAVGHVAAC